jgi:anti-anti-sigma factor
VVHAGPQKVVVAVTGEIDMACADDLQAALVEAIDRYRPRAVVIDMAEAPFLDAAGVRALVRSYRHAHRHQVEVTLIHPRPAVVRILGIVDLLTFLRVEL